MIREILRVEGLFAFVDELIIDESLRLMGFGTELLEAAIVAAKKR